LDPVNRGINVAVAYDKAQQERGQSVQSFATYLDQLEVDLPPKSEDNRCLELLAKLRPELQRAITNYQDIPNTRAALIVLAARLEENQRQARGAGHGAPNHRNEDHRPVFRQTPHGGSRDRGHLPLRGHPRDNPQPRASNRPRLSNEEYDRRRKGNLCFNCGQAGHAAAACPRQATGPNNEPIRGGPFTANLAVKGTETLALGHCVEAQVDIEGPEGWSNRKALIDLGANANFVSQICVKDCGLIPTSRQTLRVGLCHCTCLESGIERSWIFSG
jgi:hypothetical protein